MGSTDEEIVRFAPEPVFREAVARRFDEVRSQLEAVLSGAGIEHVGSTAIPGSLTKGDLDIQIRVSAEQYAAARTALLRLYVVNDGGFADVDAISFEDYRCDPPVGIHLTVIGGTSDLQTAFRDRLLASAALRSEYDDLKRRFDGGPMEAYRTAKAVFVTRVLAVGAT